MTNDGELKYDRGGVLPGGLVSVCHWSSSWQKATFHKGEAFISPASLTALASDMLEHLRVFVDPEDDQR